MTHLILVIFWVLQQWSQRGNCWYVIQQHVHVWGNWVRECTASQLLCQVVTPEGHVGQMMSLVQQQQWCAVHLPGLWADHWQQAPAWLKELPLSSLWHGWPDPESVQLQACPEVDTPWVLRPACWGWVQPVLLASLALPQCYASTLHHRSSNYWWCWRILQPQWWDHHEPGVNLAGLPAEYASCHFIRTFIMAWSNMAAKSVQTITVANDIGSKSWSQYIGLSASSLLPQSAKQLTM